MTQILGTFHFSQSCKNLDMASSDLEVPYIYHLDADNRCWFCYMCCLWELDIWSQKVRSELH